MTDYRDLADHDQVASLRPVAAAAARQFGLEVASLELVAHAFNTTFAVVGAQGQRHALRLNTNSVSTAANVVAQQAWQHAIASETDVRVPDPLRTVEGGWCAEVDCATFGRPLLVTAATWLDGPDVGDLDPVTARALGRAMALLHEHARSWRLPAHGALPRFDTPLFGDGDLLDSVPSPTREERAVLDAARAATAQAFAAVHDGASLQPVHGDLHGGNLKWSREGLAVFDFDDSGLGLPVVDLAVSTFYLRSGEPEPERALWEGYADVAPVPAVDPGHFEALVAARQLLLANSLLSSTTAELRNEAAEYLTVTVDRLRHWLKSGRFTRTVPSR
ncbi:MAG: phosphotransferase enzyme family protein [Actinomycetes bacterium]